MISQRKTKNLSEKTQMELIEGIKRKISLYNKQSEELNQANVGHQLKKMKMSFEEPRRNEQTPVVCAFKKLKEGAKTYHKVRDFKNLQRTRTLTFGY